MTITDRKRLLHIIVVVFSLIVADMVSAANPDEDFYTWAGFEMTGSLPAHNPYLKNLRYKLFMQGRFGDNSSQFSQGLIRAGTGYQFNEKVTAWLGYDWVPTGRPLALSPFNDHAVWQQLSWSNSFAFGTLISRTRLEQHFFDVPGGSDAAHLFRQMLKLSIPVPVVSPRIGVVLWNEIFVNLKTTAAGIRSGYNQNRAFAGFGYQINKMITLETGYMNQHINKSSSPRPDLLLHVLSITLLLNF